MISLIICSRTSTLPESFDENIRNTIGSEYELILIDNSQSQYSIFEAYNLGIQKSKGDILCFIHDDIRFHTIDWGKKLLFIFRSDKQIGLVGIAGAKIKGTVTSGWWDCPDRYRVINIIQHTKLGKLENWNVGWENNNLQEVVAIDGVFMSISKDDNFQFSKKFRGFHNYDLDISFKTRQKRKKIVVTNEILLEHFSEGVVDDKWIASTFKIHNYYNRLLPMQVGNKVSKEEFEKIDFDNFQKMIYLSFVHKNLDLAFKIWFKFFLKCPMHTYNNYFWKEYIKLIYRCWR
ncbi:glycosyltransferase [Flavobacterium phragmitis]|uniref:Glycosyltransferase like family protein n=1 Tax=Flavobacterium phragmitis TaxID=739143 RepID=A0A1I1UXL8_9FLAO|nr:glycosyltransferase [Flavobacterium phragmitis]SFD72760.1 Glycosyltransferase like family protein [Flavobacterium phragmitis]